MKKTIANVSKETFEKVLKIISQTPSKKDGKKDWEQIVKRVSKETSFYKERGTRPKNYKKSIRDWFYRTISPDARKAINDGVGLEKQPEKKEPEPKDRIDEHFEKNEKKPVFSSKLGSIGSIKGFPDPKDAADFAPDGTPLYGKAGTGQINDEDTADEVVDNERHDHQGIPVCPENGVRIYAEKSTQKKGREYEVEISTEDDKPLTPNDLLKALSLSPEHWTVTGYSVRNGEWNQQIKGGKIKTLFSRRVNISVAPLKMNQITPEFVEAVAEKAIAAANKTPYNTLRKIPVTIERVEEKGKRIGVLAIADLHLGKLSSNMSYIAQEGRYDTEAAKNIFYNIIKDGMKLAVEYQVEELIFYWAQDFFHYDNPRQTTTAGTPQDSDILWQDLFTLGIKLLIDATELLSTVCPVRTFYVRSNHDEVTSYSANAVLWAYWNGKKKAVEEANKYLPKGQKIPMPQVTVDLCASPRRYYHYGDWLGVFLHSDKEGNRIRGLITNEAKEHWAEAKLTEVFAGHIHHKVVQDLQGVWLHQMNSPSGTDAYHLNAGYTGAIKGANFFVRGYSQKDFMPVERTIWCNTEPNEFAINQKDWFEEARKPV